MRTPKGDTLGPSDTREPSENLSIPPTPPALTLRPSGTFPHQNPQEKLPKHRDWEKNPSPTSTNTFLGGSQCQINSERGGAGTEGPPARPDSRAKTWLCALTGTTQESSSPGAAGDPRAAQQRSDCIAHTINHRVSCPSRSNAPAWNWVKVPGSPSTAGELRNEERGKIKPRTAPFSGITMPAFA